MRRRLKTLICACVLREQINIYDERKKKVSDEFFDAYQKG
jgi:hypothetical protein